MEVAAQLKTQVMFGSYLFSSACLPLSVKGGDCGITGKNDADDFRRLLSAMEILHFTPDDQSAIFRLLSSILHLGNVYFQRYEVIITGNDLTLSEVYFVTSLTVT